MLRPLVGRWGISRNKKRSLRFRPNLNEEQLDNRTSNVTMRHDRLSRGARRSTTEGAHYLSARSAFVANGHPTVLNPGRLSARLTQTTCNVTTRENYGNKHNP